MENINIINILNNIKLIYDRKNIINNIYKFMIIPKEYKNCLYDKEFIYNICALDHDYLTWNDMITLNDFPTKKNNALKNMYTNLNYFLNTTIENMKERIKSDGVSLFIGKDEYYPSKKSNFIKSNYSLNLVGNIILDHTSKWNNICTVNLDNKLVFNNYEYNDSLNINKEKDIVFNYTVAPRASSYNLEKYKIYMRNAIKLQFYAMYNHFTNNEIKIMIWNPFGIGAFLVGYKGGKNELRKEVVSFMFEEYKNGIFDNSKFILVLGTVLKESDVKPILTNVFKDYEFESKNKSVVIITKGDMLAFAYQCKKIYKNVSVTMAGDPEGPGNHFFNLPINPPSKNPNLWDPYNTARTASDENNTRRSNLIWKVFYINLYNDLENIIAELNNENNYNDIITKICIKYKKRKINMNNDLKHVIENIYNDSIKNVV